MVQRVRECAMNASMSPLADSNCTSLTFLFESSTSAPTSIHNDVGAIVVQSIPTTSTALFCLFVEWMWWTRRKMSRPTPSRFRRSAMLVIASLTIAAQGAMLWRTASILDCDGTVHVLHDTLFLPSVVVASTSVFDVFVMWCIVPRSPRVAIATFLGLAVASIVFDYVLRGGVVVSRASQLFVAVQQTFDILAVSCIHFVPGYTLLVHRLPTKARSRVVSQETLKKVVTNPAIVQDRPTSHIRPQSPRSSGFVHASSMSSSSKRTSSHNDGFVTRAHARSNTHAKQSTSPVYTTLGLPPSTSLSSSSKSTPRSLLSSSSSLPNTRIHVLDALAQRGKTTGEMERDAAYSHGYWSWMYL